MTAKQDSNSTVEESVFGNDSAGDAKQAQAESDDGGNFKSDLKVTQFIEGALDSDFEYINQEHTKLEDT